MALRKPPNIFKQLRFRLTFSYVLFFAVLLVAVGFLFRETVRLELYDDTQATLEEEWGAAKGYLHVDKGTPIWIADQTDPEEAYIVERLRHIYLLADNKGKVLERSETYQSIGIDSPEEVARILKLAKPEFHVRQDSNGVPYLIKAGAMQGTRGRTYFLALGRSLESNERTVDNVTRRYALLLLGVIALTTLLGWTLSARALDPLDSVAKTAQEITSSNLTVQIPTRGAGDELDHLIDSFNRMTARLNQSFEQVRQFSTDVSHELRTPLTAIRGQLEVALFTAQTPEQYRDAVVNALEDVEKLSSIVRALLLLSQAESGQLVLQKGPLDLSEVVRDIVDQFQIPAEEKNLTLTAHLLPGLMTNADRTQMDRLFSNLLSNALKYTPYGGTVRVDMDVDKDVDTGVNHSEKKPGPGSYGFNHYEAPQSWLRVVVSDSGVGIPAEHLPHIFDRFFRVRDSQTNKIQGLGLGLSFVAWIVSAHDGSISVESKVGQGTRFVIRFPLVVQEPVPQNAPLSPTFSLPS
jgi:signal transduction histidine kinase